MNEHISTCIRICQDFPGGRMPRRAWTVAEIEAMVEAGIIDEDERFELIGGEVVPMSPKGARHEMVNMSSTSICRRKRRPIRSGNDRSGWTKSFGKPDFCVFPRSIAPGDIRGYVLPALRSPTPACAAISAARSAPSRLRHSRSGSSTRLRWSRACTSSLARRAIGAWLSSGQTTR